MDSTTTTRITGAPMVTLVDIDGFAVPDCERHVPTGPPDPADPADWPAWTDSWHWTPTGPDDLDDLEVDDLAEEEALELEPDAPDGDPHLHFPGIAPLIDRLALPPICGGSDEAGPSEADWDDYRRWSEALDARRDAIDFYARHPLAEFNRDRTD